MLMNGWVTSMNLKCLQCDNYVSRSWLCALSISKSNYHSQLGPLHKHKGFSHLFVISEFQIPLLHFYLIKYLHTSSFYFDEILVEICFLCSKLVKKEVVSGWQVHAQPRLVGFSPKSIGGGGILSRWQHASTYSTYLCDEYFRWRSRSTGCLRSFSGGPC